MHAMLSADALTVTTPELKQALIPFNPNVVVLPNYLDKDLWQFRQPALPMDAQVRSSSSGTPTPPMEDLEALRNHHERTAAGCVLSLQPARPGVWRISRRVDCQPGASYRLPPIPAGILGLRQISRSLRCPITCLTAAKARSGHQVSALGLAGVYAAAALRLCGTRRRGTPAFWRGMRRVRRKPGGSD